MYIHSQSQAKALACATRTTVRVHVCIVCMYCAQFNSPGWVDVPPVRTGEPKSSQTIDGRSPNGELAHGDTRGERSPGKRMSILPNVSPLCRDVRVYACTYVPIQPRHKANAWVRATQRHILSGGFVCVSAWYVCFACSSIVLARLQSGWPYRPCARANPSRHKSQTGALPTVNWRMAILVAKVVLVNECQYCQTSRICIAICMYVYVYVCIVCTCSYTHTP